MVTHRDHGGDRGSGGEGQPSGRKSRSSPSPSFSFGGNGPMAGIQAASSSGPLLALSKFSEYFQPFRGLC